MPKPTSQKINLCRPHPPFTLSSVIKTLRMSLPWNLFVTYFLMAELLHWSYGKLSINLSFLSVKAFFNKLWVITCRYALRE